MEVLNLHKATAWFNTSQTHVYTPFTHLTTFKKCTQTHTPTKKKNTHSAHITIKQQRRQTTKPYQPATNHNSRPPHRRHPHSKTRSRRGLPPRGFCLGFGTRRQVAVSVTLTGFCAAASLSVSFSMGIDRILDVFLRIYVGPMSFWLNVLAVRFSSAKMR